MKTKTNTCFGKSSIEEIEINHSISGMIVPPKRVRYLSEIAENNRKYDSWVNEQCEIASQHLPVERSY